MDDGTNPAGIMQRQEDLKLNLPESVAVIGCGGVGSWTAFFLAMAGVKELWLFDMDEVSPSNLNRLPVQKTQLGQVKSQAVAQMIHMFRPECDVIASGHFTPELAIKLGLELTIHAVVVTTDTWASRKEVRKWSDRYGVPYVEAAAEGEIGSIAGSPAEWATPQETQPGYASVPVWVGPCVAAGLLAATHLVHGSVPARDQVIRMGWNTEDWKHTFYDSSQPTPQLEELVEANEVAVEEILTGGRGDANNTTNS